ncbi:MAG: hypothetical protein HY676_05500 [Chloroflexi bacterium]|nr:hypothetical protein [Chloroflexota bacterium]
MWKRAVLYAILTLVLAACAQLTPVPTSTPTAMPTSTPTPSPTPTLTPTQTPTPTPQLARTPQAIPFDPTRLAEIDAHALSAPSIAESSVKSLAAYLVSPTLNDFEKSRTIFRWITENISYDAIAFFTKNLGDQSAETTLRKRTAVCGGYSALFQALGRAAGLEVVTVEGWAKGYGYDLSELNGETNHAWNAVRIDGRWYLVDSTWGAGALTEAGNFKPEFKPYYWLTPPAQFIVNHLPEDSQWQLLPTLISKAEYAAMPSVWPEFFEYGLELPPDTEAIARVVSQATLLVGAPPDVLLTAAVEQNGSRLDDMWAFAQRNGDRYEVEAVFPGPGKYDLIIFAKRKDESGSYKGAATLTFEVGQGQSQFAGFPTVFTKFIDSDSYLFTPKQNGLPIGSTQTFKLRVPIVEKVAVIIGKEWTYLSKQDDAFEGAVTITQGTVQVCALFDPSGNYYQCLIEYK